MAQKKTFNPDYLLGKNSSFIMQEDYKALRTNIMLSFTDPGAKAIVVTSANSSEGKTTNAINLARSFADMGKKTLLIDCDMRLPSIAARLGLPNVLGLSSCLTGETDGSAAVQENDGLFVIPSGSPLPPDPIRLLQSAAMEQLVSWAKENYDYIIMDLPPVGTMSDALVLSKLADGYVLIVKHEETTRKDVSDMLSSLKLAGAEVLGFLYVNLPGEMSGKYGKYHKYGKYGKYYDKYAKAGGK